MPAPIGPRGLSEAAEGATVRHPNCSKTPRGGAKNDNLPVTQGSLFTRDFPLEGVMEASAAPPLNYENIAAPIKNQIFGDAPQGR